MSEYFSFQDKRFFNSGSTNIVLPTHRFVWDDENPEFDYQSRTHSSGWNSSPITPAVLRYYPVMRADAGDFRVDISPWKMEFLRINNNDEQKFNYWTGDQVAQFNYTGWPMFAYLGMSGNLIHALEVIGDWIKFETLKVTDLVKAHWMTRANDPCFVHTFTCVTWKDNTTKRIPDTGTARGSIDYFLVTKEGYAYVEKYRVKKL